jgi:DNA (cytosine-5)-methyltransferase 1
MLRLQGFPEDYQIVGSYQTMRKLTGNSVAIPCVAAVVNSAIKSLLDNIKVNLEKREQATRKH